MEKNLQKLRIDQSKKGSFRRSSTNWLLVIVAFFLGAVLTNLAISYFVQSPAQAEPPLAAEANTADGRQSSLVSPQTTPDPGDPNPLRDGYVVPRANSNGDIIGVQSGFLCGRGPGRRRRNLRRG